MSKFKKKGLGRGLSALFGDEKTKTIAKKKHSSNSKALIGNLSRNPYQPRQTFDETKLKELANSIEKNGVIQPIAVRREKSGEDKFQIIAGERRWLAAQKAGLHEVPIIILDLNDNEALEVAIVENIQRDDLNVIEEAKAYERLNKEFDYDHDKIAKFMSKSRSHVSNTLRLLSLPADVVSMIREGTISAGQARPLIGIANSSEIAEQIVSKKLSARSVEYLAREKKAPQKTGQYRIDSNLIDVQQKIEENLGMKVDIYNKKNNSGKLTVYYKTLEQFEFILKLLKQR